MSKLVDFARQDSLERRVGVPIGLDAAFERPVGLFDQGRSLGCVRRFQRTERQVQEVAEGADPFQRA